MLKLREFFNRLIYSIPVFFIIVVLFGFSAEPKENINHDILFDTCIEYVNQLQNNESKDAPFESKAVALSENIELQKSDLEINPSEISIAIDSLLNQKGKDKKDSLTFLDSLRHKEWVIDSTARLNYFRYSRIDQPNISFRPKKQSSFFAMPTVNKRRTADLDSTGKFVIIKEEVGGMPTRPELKIPLEEYINLRQDGLNRDIWEDIGYKYELKEGKKDLSQLLTDITNIDIPLPSVSFLSIFGPPKINLKINGAVDIHGAWKTETTDGLTASRLGNTRSEPDFKQTVQIGVNGTIGDKLTISADWNTERTFEYENMLKIKYTGYEDEMIQSIEAGNVSLQASSLVGGSDALFGLKAQFKFGPLSLTALASQKKGEIQEMSVSGGSRTNQFEVRAYEYSKNHFFIHQDYADTSEVLNIFYNYFGNATPKINQKYRIREIQVWKTINGRPQPGERKANAFIDLSPRFKSQPPYDYNTYRDSLIEQKPDRNVINGRFVLLTENVDYVYNEYAGFISLKTGYNDVDAIAVAFRLEGNTASADDDEYYGEFLSDVQQDTSAHLVLRLVKPPNLQPAFKDAWKLQLKNIYSLKGRDIKKEGFKLDIKYQIEGQEPVNEYAGKKLLHAFELDMTDVNGTSSTPDGLFDFFTDRTIMPATGEIIFPKLQPFGGNLPGGLPEDLKYQKIYDTTDVAAKNERTKDKFTIVGEYSASVSSTYNIGFNVVENSVKVLLNGRELANGSDYTVDYNTGQVVIRNDAALVPGADLRITYEQNDLFSLASKTLVGLRGLYEFSKRTKLGFSFLNLNQQTLSDKVRIGEEPSNNSIFGVDFETSADLPFMTKALDKLFSTSAMSTVSFKGEFAYMSPDPNTKKSTISSDEGKSIAYIDDFEGSKRVIPIGVTYTAWKDLSPPDEIGNFNNLSKLQEMDYKAKSFWYNILPSNVNVKDIWPNKKASRNDQQVTVMDYVFRPTQKGTYNYTPKLDDPTKNWGGMMKLLSSSASDLTKENIEYLEFWVQVEKAPADAKIYIDLGRISEDIIPNNKLNTEDKNDNGLIDDGEDNGIDGVLDVGEPDYSSSNPDPSGDNFQFVLTSSINPDDYQYINGTQGNAQLSDNGRLPDAEDLNNNRNLDAVNSYFRYEVSLDTNRANNPFIAGGGDNANWYLYKIPLKDHKLKVNDPSFSLVEFIRLWVTGVDSEVHIRLAEFNLVGNQWQKVINPPYITANDSVLTLSTINIEDNPDYYSPPGVFRERDKSKTDEEVLANEQSLLLRLKDLKDGEKREIVKFLSTRALNVFYYKEMKLFIHGDLNNQIGSISNFTDDNDYASEVYFRFGADSLNYYEYRQPVKAGWNEIKILFNELTALKQRRDSDTATLRMPVPGVEGHYYGVKGSPTLTRLQYFTIGVINPKEKGTSMQSVSGDIWVNELRVLEADDSPGWAYTGATSLKFADILNVNVNMSRTDPNFHKLSDRFGSREDRRAWGVMADLDVIKVLPVNLPGSSFRLNYQHTESLVNPVYLPNTDIKISEASEQLEQKKIDDGYSEEFAKAEAERLKTEAQTLNVSDTWSLSNVQIKIPSTAWYIRDTFNNLNFTFNFNKSFNRSPSVLLSKGWEWTATAKHNVNISTDYFFYPVKLPLIGDLLELFTDYRNVKIYYAPQSFSSDLTARRNYRFTQNRVSNSAPSINRDFTSSRSAGFIWKVTEGGLLNLTVNYKIDFLSTYAHLLTDSLGQDRNNSEIWGDIFSGSLFGKDLSFKQTTDFKLNPKMPAVFNLNKYFSLTAGYTVSYSWENRINQKDLGRGAGFGNSISSGLTLRWKSLWEPLFKESTEPSNNNVNTNQQQQNTRGRQRDIDEELTNTNVVKNTDSTVVVKDSLDTTPKVSSITKALAFLKFALKYILFDYEQITFNFKQTNSVSGSGIAGDGTGFNNFWGFMQRDYQGPSRLFMLGLSNDIGPRAPNGNLTDNFRQSNAIDFKTSRPLWEGATIDIDWRLSWDVSKTTSLTTDSLGNINITNVTSTGKIERSFFSMPPTLFLSVFKSGITRVNELYNPNAVDPNRDLADAFVQGFESFSVLGQVPILSKLMKYVPRPNWRINWNGLEKYPLFKNFAKRVSFNHAYQSSYSEGWKINPDGLNETQSQRIMYGFQPLAGLNFTFNSLWNGDFSATAKFSTKTTYDLGISNKNITESFQRDINITASYKKSGFEIPLFGISLKNDIEVSFSYTMGKTSSVKYDMQYFREEGTPLEGSTRTTMEPRLKYVMSSKVTLSLFYTRTTVEPEGASAVPATTTNVAGLDIHIAIQ